MTPWAGHHHHLFLAAFSRDPAQMRNERNERPTPIFFFYASRAAAEETGSGEFDFCPDREEEPSGDDVGVATGSDSARREDSWATTATAYLPAPAADFPTPPPPPKQPVKRKTAAKPQQSEAAKKKSASGKKKRGGKAAEVDDEAEEEKEEEEDVDDDNDDDDDDEEGYYETSGGGGRRRRRVCTFSSVDDVRRYYPYFFAAGATSSIHYAPIAGAPG